MNVTEEEERILDEAAHVLYEAKKKEANAKKEKQRAESALIKIAGLKDEGSMTRNTKNYRITTTAGVDRKIEPTLWAEIVGRVPLHVLNRVISYSPKLKVKAFRDLNITDPDKYRQILAAVVTSPRKAAVRIERTSEWQ